MSSRRSQSWLVALSLAAGICLGFLIQQPESLVRPLAAQEEQENEELNRLRQQAEELERELDGIGEAIEQAVDNGDDQKAAELRKRAEELFGRLDQIAEQLPAEFEEEGNEFAERELAELELHRQHLEIEHLNLENRLTRVELASRLAEIAGDHVKTAALAIEEIATTEEVEVAYDRLESLQNDSANVAVKRLVKLKMAQLAREMGDQDAAFDALEQTLKIFD